MKKELACLRRRATGDQRGLVQQRCFLGNNTDFLPALASKVLVGGLRACRVQLRWNRL
jgi:hypothetical protein